MKVVLAGVAIFPLCFVLGVSCGGSSNSGGSTSNNNGDAGDRPELTGAACEEDSECFPDVADGELQGEAMCLTRVRDGYCTHTCEEDDDCCAADGECKTELPQVCSPFESADGKMCFLTCEDEDIELDPDADDEQAFCQRNVGPDFICRSSGGGSENRKVCVPGDCSVGADCASNDDCSDDLECIGSFAGGYCGKPDCESNDDCPGDSLCVSAAGGKNYCYRTCGSASDCSFCRHDGFFAACRDDVTFAEDGTSGSVCVPTAG
jgi:hypothetical protein